jgi:hypothetical protein
MSLFQTKYKSDERIKSSPQQNEFKSRFYEELLNNPFVIGVYSSDFEEFFQKDISELLGKNVLENHKQYLHKYITSLNFNSSINGPFMSIDFTCKMSPEDFHNYFQNRATKNITTGQWIALYTRNQAAILKGNLSSPDIQNVEVPDISKKYPDPTLGPSGSPSVPYENLKAVGNADNIPGVDYLDSLLDQVNKTNETEERNRVKAANKKLDMAMDEYKAVVESYDREVQKEVNQNLQPYHCMFWGTIENITYRISMSNTTPVFDVVVRCTSFQTHMERDQFLVALPQIEENVGGAIYNKSLSEYAKNKNFKPIQAFIKDIDYWKSMIKNFTKEGVSTRQNLGHEIKKILLSLQRNYLPLEMHTKLVDKPYLDPISNEKINENKLLTLGAVVNVATEQQHLPKQSAYRQMLPLVARYSSTIDRFKTTLSGKGTAWDLIRGTFQIDPNLIECFPIMIPFNNRQELKDAVEQLKQSKKDTASNQFLVDGTTQPSFQPFLYDEAIYKFYEQLGGIPTIIYRLKPLQPNGQISRDNINLINDIAGATVERLKNATYSEKLVLDENDLVIKYLNIETKGEFDFKKYPNNKIKVTDNQQEVNLGKFGFRDKLNLNKDAPFSKLLPTLCFDELSLFDATQSEMERINGLYIENPVIRQKSNLTIGAFADPIINIRDASTQGFRFYESDYPFFDVYLGKSTKEMSAIIERYYAIYGAGHERARGQIQIKMNYNPDILVGSWIRICMQRQSDAVSNQSSTIDLEFLNSKKNFKNHEMPPLLDDTKDFFCYVESISYNYLAEKGVQCMCTINYTRGTFGLNYAHFPNVRLENHLQSTKTLAEAKIDYYMDSQKSKGNKTVPVKQQPDDISKQNTQQQQTPTQELKTQATEAHTVQDFNNINNKSLQNSVDSIEQNQKDFVELTKEDNVEEKRFESNTTNMDINKEAKNIPLPIIEKEDLQSSIVFGPYKVGETGPFPKWPDIDDNFILDETELFVLFPDPRARIENIIRFNTDAKNRGFERMTTDEVLQWQIQNGVVPDPANP